MNPKWVNLTDGEPLERDFVTTEGHGSPICVDKTTGISYILIDHSVIPLVGTVTPKIFGAKGDGTTDDLAALQAFNDWGTSTTRTGVTLDFGGYYAINGTFYPGPVTPISTNDRYNIEGDLAIKQLGSNVFETVHVRSGLRRTTWRGGIQVFGKEGKTALFAAKTSGIGITFQDSSIMRFTGTLTAYGFWYAGISFDNTGGFNNDDFNCGQLVCYNCGSGFVSAGWSLTANWSTPVRTGSSANTNQRDTITVDALPNSLIETYRAVGGQAILVYIGTNWYYVKSWDRVANTLTIYPWLDAATYAAGAGSGTLRYAFGGGLMTAGSDSNIMTFDHAQILSCGIGYNAGALYGSRINGGQTSNCGIGWVVGPSTAGVHMGDSLHLYTEANTSDLVVVGVTDNTWNYLNGSYAFDINKVQVISARDTSTDTTVWGLGFRNSGDPVQQFVSLNVQGNQHAFQAHPVTNPPGSSTSFKDHSLPPRVYRQERDSQTINLVVVSTAFNRLFGYRGAIWGYDGTGTNGAPTGSFIFVPPAGGTINGGAVNASAVFSNFYGPVYFDIAFTDAAQLTWIIRPITGWRLSGTATYNPPSIAAGGTTTTTVTVTGVALGDGVNISFSLDLQGLVLTAYVSAADTVTAVFYNPTAGAIDLASGTLTARKIG